MICPAEKDCHAGEVTPLRVLFPGPLRTMTGCEQMELAFPADASQGAFWTDLLVQFPQLGPPKKSIRLARDHAFLPEDAELHPGDEIVLIAPVSGG